MSYEHIRYETDGPVLTITLNRPDALNAFTPTMRRELIEAFSRADEDDGIRAIVVTGEGRAFCAGADLSRGGDTFNYDKRPDMPDGAPRRDGGGLVTLQIFRCKKPVIAAINGAAVGIGATMLLPMDIRIAARSARFGFVFSRRGVVPEACSSWFLPRVVGISRALEWVYKGDVFGAEEALDGGLVRQVVDDADLLPTARALANEIAANTSAVSVAMARQMMWHMLGQDHPMEAHKVDSKAMEAMGKAADVKEGVNAFLEKRAPKFSMRPSSDMPEVYPWWDEPEFS